MINEIKCPKCKNLVQRKFKLSELEKEFNKELSIKEDEITELKTKMETD